MKRLLLTLALTFFAIGAQAAPISLTDLLNGGSITVGDKQFDGWEIVFQDASDGGTVDTDNIMVDSLADDGTGPGLIFNILNDEFRVLGTDPVFSYLDFQFAFRVTVLDPSFRVNGVSLGLGGALVSLGGGADAGSYILESVGTGSGLDDLGTMDVQFSWLDPDLTSDVSGSVAFGGRTEIWVTKNILVWASEEEVAQLTEFSQRFAQTTTQVPEPAPLALVALALAGLLLVRRRPI